MFTSSVAALLEEFHIDGIRVDLAESIHRDNRLHADGRPVESANVFGQKLLREITRTVGMIKPTAFAIAEDHSGWSGLTLPANDGGLAFDAIWYSDFCHHLIGDGKRGREYARLLRTAGIDGDGPLAMGSMGGALMTSRRRTVTYAESHDEAGNGEDTARMMVVAVNGAPLIGATRRYAEARSRFAFGVCVLSAGTPMFLMGEEIGAVKPFRYDDFARHKEDLVGERQGSGRLLYRFYQDVIKLRRLRPALRARGIDVLYTDDANRVIAFLRTDGLEDALVVGSLANRPFDHGYVVGAPGGRLPDGTWREIFNSDAGVYGGDDVGNGGGTVISTGGRLDVVIPMNGFVVLLRV
jgi:1,4-alpha-glucan branching enzyme